MLSIYKQKDLLEDLVEDEEVGSEEKSGRASEGEEEESSWW